MLYLRKIISSIIDILIILIGLTLIADIIYSLITIYCKNEDIRIISLTIISVIVFYLINLFIIKKDSLKGNRSIGKIIMRLYICDANNNIVEDKKILEKRNIMNKKHWINCIISKLRNEHTPGDLVAIAHIEGEKF